METGRENYFARPITRNGWRCVSRSGVGCAGGAAEPFGWIAIGGFALTAMT